MFKRPVLLSLLAALAVALPLQSMLASLAPAAGPRPGMKANQATLAIRAAGARILLKDGFALTPLGMRWRDGTRHRNWKDQFGGYGKVGVSRDRSKVQASIPKVSRSRGETHAALVTSLVLVSLRSTPPTKVSAMAELLVISVSSLEVRLAVLLMVVFEAAVTVPCTV